MPHKKPKCDNNVKKAVKINGAEHRESHCPIDAKIAKTKAKNAENKKNTSLNTKKKNVAIY